MLEVIKSLWIVSYWLILLWSSNWEVIANFGSRVVTRPRDLCGIESRQLPVVPYHHTHPSSWKLLLLLPLLLLWQQPQSKLVLSDLLIRSLTLDSTRGTSFASFNTGKHFDHCRAVPSTAKAVLPRSTFYFKNIMAFHVVKPWEDTSLIHHLPLCSDDQPAKWMKESEILEMFRLGIKYMDITDYQDAYDDIKVADSWKPCKYKCGLINWVILLLCIVLEMTSCVRT